MASELSADLAPQQPKWNLRSKAELFARVTRQSGLLAGLGIVANRLGAANGHEKGRLVKHSSLLQPIELDSNSDYYIYDETVLRKANSLPEQLSSRINGRPILDIGANIGVTAALYASTYPQSRVTAIEPHPRNTEILKRNAAAYDGRIRIIEAAVSLQNSAVPLANPDAEQKNSHGQYRFSANGEAQGGVVVAPAISPEEIARIYQDSGIGLMKVDIEGAEKDLFAPPRIDQLLKLVDVLAIETHDRFVPGCLAAVNQAT